MSPVNRIMERLRVAEDDLAREAEQQQRIANIGVHGKPVRLDLDKLWDRNIALTTRLVDTVSTPRLLKLLEAGKMQPGQLVTHRFDLSDTMHAYDTFADAAKAAALKVVLKG